MVFSTSAKILVKSGSAPGSRCDNNCGFDLRSPGVSPCSAPKVLLFTFVLIKSVQMLSCFFLRAHIYYLIRCKTTSVKKEFCGFFLHRDPISCAQKTRIYNMIETADFSTFCTKKSRKICAKVLDFLAA